MSFDFDRIIERRDTDSIKWRRYAGRDVLPLWVADMDFPAPPAVLDALRARVDHGILGYAEPTTSTTDTILDMLEKNFAWRIEAEWLVWTPGVATALHLIARMLEKPEDALLTSTPIYPPFLHAARNMGHVVRQTPLIETTRLATGSPSSALIPSDGGRGCAEPFPTEPSEARYEFDWERFEAALHPPTRTYLFCHPQNPTGRVWSRPELERVAELCLRHNVTICSDEVHYGLILDPDKTHIPMAALSPEIAARTITLLSPSKTYNVAGLMCAFAIIPDASLRRRFQGAARGIVNELNPFGYVACEAAYRHGEPWRLALIDYLRGNRDLVESTVARLPGLRMNHVEATYLAWIDCRKMTTDNRQPTTISPSSFFESAGVGLSDGAIFGAPGFARLNFGCPRATLREALARMQRALNTPS